MTGLEVIILIIYTALIAGVVLVAYFISKRASMEEFSEEIKKEKIQPRKVSVVKKEAAITAQELPNKEVSATVEKKTTKEEEVEEVKEEAKTQFPTDKLKKKRKYYPKKKQ